MQSAIHETDFSKDTIFTPQIVAQFIKDSVCRIPWDISGLFLIRNMIHRNLSFYTTSNRE